MTNREFIQSDKEGSCNSLFREDGTLYSYGYHYPLKFEIDGLTFRNISGYSQTTARHIYYTIADYDIQLYRAGELRGKPTKEAVLEALHHELNDLTGQMEQKKRKDTQVYAVLDARLSEVNEALEALTIS